MNEATSQLSRTGYAILIFARRIFVWAPVIWFWLLTLTFIQPAYIQNLTVMDNLAPSFVIRDLVTAGVQAMVVAVLLSLVLAVIQLFRRK